MAKTVLVTGASGGIGEAIAKEFGKNGFNVVVHYSSNKEKADEIADAIRRGGANAISVGCDISSSAEVKNMFKHISETFGPVTHLVNNAGIAHYSLFTDITEDEWDRMFDINVKGMYLCIKEALPDMIRNQKGKIVNISSVWGITGASCEVSYSSAKAAVIGLTKALAKEVGPSGICVNCVAPGVIETPMISNLDDEDIAALKDETPLGVIGTPQNVADAVFFLSGEKADFITGQVLSPNGGFVI